MQQKKLWIYNVDSTTPQIYLFLVGKDHKMGKKTRKCFWIINKKKPGRNRLDPTQRFVNPAPSKRKEPLTLWYFKSTIELRRRRRTQKKQGNINSSPCPLSKQSSKKPPSSRCSQVLSSLSISCRWYSSLEPDLVLSFSLWERMWLKEC